MENEEEYEVDSYWEKEKSLLSKLFQEYGYDISSINQDDLISCLHSCRSDIINQSSFYNTLNRPEDIILFIHDCQNSKVKLCGSVTNPRKGQIKGVPIEIEISETYLMGILDAAKILFGIIEKEQYEEPDELFSLEEELNKITEDQYSNMESISKFKKNVNKHYKGNAQNGRHVSIIYEFLEAKGIFKAKKEAENSGGKAEGITKEYCFIYDCLFEFEALPEAYTNKDKFDKIKYFLEAYERQTKKIFE